MGADNVEIRGKFKDNKGRYAEIQQVLIEGLAKHLEPDEEWSSYFTHEKNSLKLYIPDTFGNWGWAMEFVSEDFVELYPDVVVEFTCVERYGRDVTKEKFLHDGKTTCVQSNTAALHIPIGTKIIDSTMIDNAKYLVSIDIPEGVEEIADDTFYKCRKLESVTMPESLKKIGDRAFEKCKRLKEINLPQGLQEIGQDAFVGCESIIEIVIPDGVTVLETTFTDCKGLISITLPQGLKSMGDFFGWIFAGCQKLKEIQIPKGVTKIGSQAFAGCKSLVRVEIPEGVTQIDNSAFAGCESIIEMHIPRSVQSIGEQAFKGCVNLEKIYISNGNTSITPSTFENCGKVNVIIHQEVPVKFGWWSLSEKDLTTVTVPEGVLEIGDSAFSGWYNLTTVILPKSLTKIGEKAFAYTSLENLIIPEGVTTIGEMAFMSCNKLEDVIIPDGVTDIGNGAFANCRNLRHVVISKNVVKIRKNVFYGCGRLSSVICQEGLKEIEERAFSGVSDLKITLPKGVSFKREFAFWSCKNLAIDEPALHDFDKVDSLDAKDSLFALTGFREEEEERIKKIILYHGGAVKNYVTLKTNYLIVNENYHSQTSKYKNALMAKEKGKPLYIISSTQFYNLIFDQVDSLNVQNATFVLTGIAEYEREEIKKLILKKGGEIKTSVTSTTNYVVVGEGHHPPSAQYEKALIAKEKGKPVCIIGTTQFYKLINKRTRRSTI